MMDPFPNEWELLSLFEVEPKVAYDIVYAPLWPPAFLEFDTTRGDDRIVCQIAPHYESKISLKWWQGGHEHVSLVVTSIRGLIIETLHGFDYFVASIDSLERFELHLKPYICVRWGQPYGYWTSFPD
jgi:hypothetical protein